MSLHSKGLLDGTVRSPRANSAKSRGADLVVTSSALVSDTAMMRLIDEAIVPPMIKGFLAEKGLLKPDS